MQWHQLDHMLTICSSIQIDNHTNTSSLNFTGRMLFLTPNQQCQSTEGQWYNSDTTLEKVLWPLGRRTEEARARMKRAFVMLTCSGQGSEVSGGLLVRPVQVVLAGWTTVHRRRWTRPRRRRRSSSVRRSYCRRRRTRTWRPARTRVRRPTTRTSRRHRAVPARRRRGCVVSPTCRQFSRPHLPTATRRRARPARTSPSHRRTATRPTVIPASERTNRQSL